MVYEILRSRPGRRRDEDDIRDAVDEDGDIVPITDEELLDCGYVGYWELPKKQELSKRHKKIGACAMRIVCGDCSKTLTPGQGCGHMRVGKRGKVYLSDHPKF